MRSFVIVGVILLLVGGLILAYQGITYTIREKVLDVGPVHVTAEKEKTVPLPPVIGAVALAGGAALLIAGLRRR